MLGFNYTGWGSCNEDSVFRVSATQAAQGCFAGFVSGVGFRYLLDFRAKHLVFKSFFKKGMEHGF